MSALQRDLGMTAAQIPAYLATEERAVRRQGEARAALGSSFAGAWLERDRAGNFKLVLATTDISRAANIRGSGEEARVVQRSLDALETVMSRLNRVEAAIGSVDPAIHSWRIDLPGNSVVITIDPDAQAQANNFIAISGAEPGAIRLETSKNRPKPGGVIQGGDRYWRTATKFCSMGFSVRRGTSTGFATAGHCGTINTTVKAANNVDVIGYVAASQYPGADKAWVLNNNPGAWSIAPRVNAYAAGSLNVIGNMEVLVGAAVCRSGTTTGWRCGTVTGKNVAVNYYTPSPGGIVYGMAESNACAGYGDSGGPFVSPGGEAQGVSGAANFPADVNDNCGATPIRTWWQPIQPLLKSYGLLLDTVQTCGRMNPGRTLAAGASVTSCDGRFTFSMQSDGHLVPYKAGAPIWWNNVFGSGHYLAMQTDGNLVVYRGTAPVWNTGTQGHDYATLLVQNDGNVVLYDHQWNPLWYTGTAGR